MVKLKVIEGGAKRETGHERCFVSAFVSDTRLMGVIGLYIHWTVNDRSGSRDLHQFFYLDHEEYGLESYVSIGSDDMDKVAESYNSMIGCLGGESIPVTKDEACVILREYAEVSRKNGFSLPENTEEYRMLIESAPAYSEEQRKALLKKECAVIDSDWQLVNYFLMRCLGKDHEAAELLTDGNVDTRQFDTESISALCRNEIDGENGDYICQSLVETDSNYHIYVSKLKTKDLKVVFFELSSGFDISPREAAMQLARPEFVTVYELSGDSWAFIDIRNDMEYSTVMSSYENGRLFMIFNDNNDHVRKRVFLLNGDVFGVCYITDTGQMIAAAYSKDCIERLERALVRSSAGPYMTATAKYEFKEPVLYDFIQSDYEDFEEFLDDIRK